MRQLRVGDIIRHVNGVRFYRTFLGKSDIAPPWVNDKPVENVHYQWGIHPGTVLLVVETHFKPAEELKAIEEKLGFTGGYVYTPYKVLMFEGTRLSSQTIKGKIWMADDSSIKILPQRLDPLPKWAEPPPPPVDWRDAARARHEQLKRKIGY